MLDSLDPQVHGPECGPRLPPDVQFHRGDVRDRAACAEALDGVDVVVHCAAAVGVAQSLYRVEHYVDVNVRGTATLLECLAERTRPIEKLIVPTSMTGYGEGLYRRPSDGRLLRVGIRSEEDIVRHGWEPACPDTGELLEAMPTPEDAGLLARNVYALTKRYQEELSLALAQRLLGFVPRVAWEDGLAELVAWAREADAADGFAQADHELRARGLVSGPIGRRTAS